MFAENTVYRWVLAVRARDLWVKRNNVHEYTTAVRSVHQRREVLALNKRTFEHKTFFENNLLLQLQGPNSKT